MPLPLLDRYRLSARGGSSLLALCLGVVASGVWTPSATAVVGAPVPTPTAGYQATASYAATNLVVDASGYFHPGTAGSTYVPLGPVRLLDTRTGNGLGGTFLANSPRVLRVSGRGGVRANTIRAQVTG